MALAPVACPAAGNCWRLIAAAQLASIQTPGPSDQGSLVAFCETDVGAARSFPDTALYRTR